MAILRITQVENSYILCAADPLPAHCRIGQIISFRNNDFGHHELPDPRLLAVHAALAKVSEASRAVEHTNRLLGLD
jgi:hypothetical protein